MKVQTLTAFVTGGEGGSGQHTAPRDWVPAGITAALVSGVLTCRGGNHSPWVTCDFVAKQAGTPQTPVPLTQRALFIC